jgi:hypothetical protein
MPEFEVCLDQRQERLCFEVLGTQEHLASMSRTDSSAHMAILTSLEQLGCLFSAWSEGLASYFSSGQKVRHKYFNNYFT